MPTLIVSLIIMLAFAVFGFVIGMEQGPIFAVYFAK